MLKFFFTCLVILLAELIGIFPIGKDNKNENINDNKNENEKNKNDIKKYEDDCIIFEYLIIFLVSKYGGEVYYKHHYISVFIFIIVEIIKAIYFLTNNLYEAFDIIEFVMIIIYSILYAIYYLYIRKFMKIKFISPSKFNFMIGIIDVPLILIIYFIISFISEEIKDNKQYLDNIFKLFDKENFDAYNVINLILLPFAYGMNLFLINKVIYDYTIYHIYIVFLIVYFIYNIIYYKRFVDIIFLITSFFIELIMILVFLEIIEINCFGLNKNLKRNIELRGTIDSSLDNEDEDDDYDGINEEKNDENYKNTYSNL